MSSATMDIPIDQLRALPLEQRLQIIKALWQSIEDEVAAGLDPEAFADELDRRYEQHVADPDSSIPWKEVRAKLRSCLDVPARGAQEKTRVSSNEQAEIDRRLADHRQNPGAATPVDRFLDELDRRYG